MKLTTDDQYLRTQVWISRFEDTLYHLEAAPPGVHPTLVTAEREGLESMLVDLRQQSLEYMESIDWRAVVS